jgi:hypothetical protein
MGENKKFIKVDDLIENFLEGYLAPKKHQISIDTTTLKWGSEYEGEVSKTTHLRVKVDSKVISYDYKNLKELLTVLKLLSNVEIIFNGEILE